MNVLVANLQWDHGSDSSLTSMQHLQFPTGLATIAGEICLNRKDNLFVIDNYTSDIDENDLFNFIEDNAIDCILLSMFLGNYQYYYLKKFLNQVTKEFPATRVIIGGPLASTVPDLLIRNTTGHTEQIIMVLGEGEETIIDLLDCLESESDLSKVRGICYTESGKIVLTPERPRIKNLDVQSRPAYHLFDTEKYVNYVKSENRCWELISSRGCYGSCRYCKLVFGRKITRRSAQSIVDEMTDFFHTYGIERFNFVDDNFLNSERQSYEFIDALAKSDIDFQWRFQGRADRFPLHLTRALIKVGLYDVSFGIESGSPEILQEMNKPLNLERARQNLRALSRELDVHGTFIVGMPGESHETITKTIEFIEDAQLGHATGGILTLFPATALYEMAHKKGFIPDEDRYCENIGPVYVRPYLNLTGYPDEQLVAWSKMIDEAGNGGAGRVYG